METNLSDTPERPQDALRATIQALCDVQIGYQHRGGIDDPASGTHCIIQIKDIKTIVDNGGSILDCDSIDRVTPKGNPDRYLVSKGDVLFLSRGQKLFAVALPDVPPDTIAAHYFYILRPDTSIILPEYLAWYINQTPAQNFIESRMRGSHMLMIPKSSFEHLEIEIPSLKIQKSIIELDRLRRREESLLTKLIDTRQRLVQGISLNAVQNNLDNRSSENE